MRKAVALVVCVLIVPGIALADIAVSIPDFNVSAGNPWSHGVTLTEGQTIYGLNLQGWWDDNGSWAYPSEMEVYVNPPSGNAFDWDPITDVTGTDPYYFDETLSNVWPTGEDAVGYWSFCFGTSYGNADMWDVTMNLLSTEPEPPTPPDSTLLGVPSETDAYMGEGNVDWYSFTIGGTLDMTMDLSLTETNFPVTGIDDAEMGLYDVWGSRIAYDDDSGAGLLPMFETTLDAGTYYLAVAGYNSTFGLTDFGVTGGGVTGDYTLEIIPEPSALVLLALGGVALLRRR